MKIDETHRVLLEQQGKINKNKKSEAGSFQQMMDQMISSAETKKALPVNINPVQIINGPAGTFPINESIEPAKKDLLLDSLKETLDIIDFYATKLADESFPTENLSSLVDQLDERLGSIKDMSAMEGVPEKLKPVISEVAITIGTEIERFRRGDYV